MPCESVVDEHMHQLYLEYEHHWLNHEPIVYNNKGMSKCEKELYHLLYLLLPIPNLRGNHPQHGRL